MVGRPLDPGLTENDLYDELARKDKISLGEGNGGTTIDSLSEPFGMELSYDSGVGMGVSVDNALLGTVEGTLAKEGDGAKDTGLGLVTCMENKDEVESRISFHDMNKRNICGKEGSRTSMTVLIHGLEGNRFGVLRIDDGGTCGLDDKGKGRNGLTVSPKSAKTAKETRSMVIGNKGRKGASNSSIGKDRLE
ncbi:hypothetical protein V6N13_072714 [Hibiscus sabdariffa]